MKEFDAFEEEDEDPLDEELDDLFGDEEET